MTARKKSQDPSISSEERKKKHGSTAPHGGTSRGKTHIGGNSLDTCTQGSTSPLATGHRAMVTGLPTTDPPTAGQSPNGEEDTSGRLGMPCHWPPGIGHRAPATGQSPSTGQMGETETSSLPITGHLPSRHRSLELDRLNSREIQESPSTGHARSPSNRPSDIRI